MASGTTVDDLLLKAATAVPDRPAIVDARGVLTYAQFAEETLVLAGALQRRFSAGSRILILLRNSRDLPIWTLACSRSRLVPVLCDPTAIAGDVGGLIEQFRPGLVVSEPADERAADLGADWEAFTDHHRAVSALSVGPTDPVDVSGSNAYGAICTSGSSGAPKGVLLSHAAWIESANRLSATLDLHDGDVALHSAPLAHGSGLLFAAVLVHHGTNVILRTFDPGAFLEAAADWRATVTFLVPTMLYDLLEEGGFNPEVLTAMRTVNYSGGPADPLLVLRAAARWGPRLVQDYGLWEAPAPQLVLGRDDHERLAVEPDRIMAASCGRPVRPVELSIRRSGGPPAAIGEDGEVVISGPTLMTGYLLGSHISTSSVADGLLWTGDIARSDADGYVTLVGRKSNVVVTGGKKVSPERVESVLAECSAVRQIAVVGVPHERWGEMLVALVVPTPGATTVGKQLDRLARKRLAAHERPKVIIERESLPVGPHGKRRRQDLTAIARAELTAPHRT